MTEPVSEPKFRVLCEDFQQIDNAKSWELLLILARYSEGCKQAISRDELTNKFRTDFNRKDSDHDILRYIELLTKSRIIHEERKHEKLYYYIMPDMLRRWLRIQNYYQKHIS